MSHSFLEAAIHTGAQTSDWSSLDDWLVSQSGDLMDDDTFGTLLGALTQPDGQAAEGAYNLLAVFQDEWDRIGEPDRQRLLPVLVETYPSFQDPTVWLVVAELVGRFYGGREALLALRHMGQTDQEGPRALVAVGLGHLARSAGHRSVADEACQDLERMTHDPADTVREEARGQLPQPGRFRRTPGYRAR